MSLFDFANRVLLFLLRARLLRRPKRVVQFSLLLQFSQSLDVHPMGLLLCGKIASIIKGMSLEDYHKTFELEKDFTPEEEEQIRKDNSWAES